MTPSAATPKNKPITNNAGNANATIVRYRCRINGIPTIVILLRKVYTNALTAKLLYSKISCHGASWSKNIGL